MLLLVFLLMILSFHYINPVNLMNRLIFLHFIHLKIYLFLFLNLVLRPITNFLVLMYEYFNYNFVNLSLNSSSNIFPYKLDSNF